MSLVRRKPARINPPNDEELCTLREAAEILKLNPASIRQRLGGTRDLTHIRRGNPGSQRMHIILIKSEVLALRRRWITEAKEQSERSENVTEYLRGDHPTLSKEEIKRITAPYKIKGGSS